MARFTPKMYPQPTTIAARGALGSRFTKLIERTRAVISVLVDVGRLIDRGAALMA